jgi:hypothetical protein
MQTFNPNDKVRLRKLHDIDLNEWLESYPSSVVQAMFKAQEERLVCTVDLEACEGYYDVTLPCGAVLDAISHYHLAKV